MKKPKTELVKDFLIATNLDDFGSVQEIINAFCEQSGETITYSQFHQIYKSYLANPVAFKRAAEMSSQMNPAVIAEVEEEIVTVRMKDVKIDPILFTPLKTGKGIDVILSDTGGVLRGCINMVIGDPGAGKSTITADVLADLEVNNKKMKLKTLYIQGEQSVIDAGYYYNKTPRTGNIDNLFLSQYANPCKALEKVMLQGWDVIVLDSFNDVLLKIKAATNMSTSAVETYLINLMVKTAEGANDAKKYTSFFCIQQVTKGGEFVGSNVIKHATTAMMEVRYDENNKDERYVEFTKNRRCGDAVFKRLYFSLEKTTGEIVYDLQRFNDDQIIMKQANVEEMRNAKSADDFKAIMFGGATAGNDVNFDQLAG
jgi:RecA/RadA recombinase